MYASYSFSDNLLLYRILYISVKGNSFVSRELGKHQYPVPELPGQ